MARRFVIFVIAFAIPLIALLSHNELRRVLMWDVLILTFKTPSQAMELLPKPTAPLYRGIGEAESSQDKERWLSYEQLYRRTGEVWIGVFGLRYSGDTVRLEGEVSEQKRKSIEGLLKLATELSERDKDNAFPLLVKAHALFALGRDDEALSTFHDAILRPHYRTYEEKWAQVKVPKTLTAEERTFSLADILFPHLSQLRELARRVMKHSADASMKGDFQRGLSLAEDVIKLGAKMRDQGFWLVEPLVGIAIQFIGFAGGAMKPVPTTRDASERLKEAANRFAEFARKHGRSDLAEWALKEAEKSVRVHALIRKYLSGNFFVGGIKQRESLRLTNNRLTSFSLLLSALALAIVALISSAFLWRTKVTIDSYSPITAALVVSGLPFAAIVWGIFGALKGEFWEATKDETYFAAIYLPSAVLLLLFALCFLPALWQLRGKVNWRTIAVLIGFPALVGALTIVAVNTPVFWAFSLLLALLLLLALFGIIAATLWLRSKLDVQVPLIRIFSAVSLAIMFCALLFTVLWFTAVLESTRWTLQGTEVMPIFLTIALVAVAFTFFIAWGIWSRFGNPEYRHICQGALARLKGAAILLLLVCWWGYGIVQFSSSPLRAKIHRTIDEVIVHGEVELVKRVVSSTPQFGIEP